MARPLRIEYPGAIYHVTSRGNARLRIYEDDQDRRSFLRLLEEVVDRYHWLCHAYCLMDNHYHLLIETSDGNLSQGMRQLNGIYTQRFNRRHGKVGHIFQGRFKAILVDRESYLLELCRYVVLNPVRTGTVARPAQYAWSSYGATAGMGKAPAFLTRDWLLAQFGEDRHISQRKYQEFVTEGINGISPWEKLEGQLLLGGEKFLERLNPVLKGKATLKEIPRAQRFANRPKLGDMLLSRRDDSKLRRDKAIRDAHFQYGYSLAEIARRLGFHYTTVSKIVNAQKP